MVGMPIVDTKDVRNEAFPKDFVSNTAAGDCVPSRVAIDRFNDKGVVIDIEL